MHGTSLVSTISKSINVSVGKGRIWITCGCNDNRIARKKVFQNQRRNTPLNIKVNSDIRARMWEFGTLQGIKRGYRPHRLRQNEAKGADGSATACGNRIANKTISPTKYHMDIAFKCSITTKEVTRASNMCLPQARDSREITAAFLGQNVS